MNIYDLISGLVLLPLVFFIYSRIKRSAKSSSQQGLQDDSLNPHLVGIDLGMEDRVRRQWLISLFVISAIVGLTITLGYFAEGLFSEFANMTSPAFAIVLGFFLPSLVVIPWFWITYHCAYKKRGTNWLMWTLISIPAREFIDIFKGDWAQATEWGLYVWLIILISLASEVYYWVNCLRLYKFNSFRKRHTALALREEGQA